MQYLEIWDLQKGVINMDPWLNLGPNRVEG